MSGLFTTPIIMAIIRHAITTFGGVLIAKGVIDEATWNTMAGSLIVLIGNLASIYEKKKRF